MRSSLVIHYIFELCYAMLSSLDRHHICETISWPLFSTLSIAFVSHTMYVHLTMFPVYQPFELEQVMPASSGLKTRSTNKIVLPVEADLLLGPDSSSEMDSETNDQSYSPTEVYALTWHGYTAHIMRNWIFCPPLLLHWIICPPP